MKTWKPKNPVIVIKTCDENMQAYNGFRWPKKGYVKAPDWKKTFQCGNGLHGLMQGQNNDAVWHFNGNFLALEVEASEIIDLGDKVKFPQCNVIHSGTRESLFEFLDKRKINYGWQSAIINNKTYGATVLAVDHATVTVGDGSKVTVGDYSKVFAGSESTVTTGYSSEVTVDYDSKVKAGRVSLVKTGANCIVIVEDNSKVTVGINCTVIGINHYLNKTISTRTLKPGVTYRYTDDGKFVELKLNI